MTNSLSDNHPAITRFAPSPTGYIHIGNVRSAIYPFLLARQTGGRLILRIEDTDQNRYIEGATEVILDTLKWLGIEWEEGPVVGGPAAPYYQSERREIYHTWAKKLLAAGRAYADPTPSETIAKYREAANKAKIPYLYRNHRPENPPEWKPGIPLRFKSEPKSYHWHDEVMGDLSTGAEAIDDIILIKADGLPTYNFAHIVDDAEMGVTHVIRGSEYISSTPNYLALYEALSLAPPKLVSLPHILGPTGGKKLSKRDGAKSVTDYRHEGILAEALFNYLACLGWNDGTEQEIYTVEELIAKFSLDRVQNSGARFDETKLLWINGQWIRKVFTERGVDALYNLAKDFWITNEIMANYSTDYCKQVLSITYDRLKTLADLPLITSYFFSDPKIDLNLITNCKFLKKFTSKELANLLDRTVTKLSNTDWTENSIQNALNFLLAEAELKPAEYFSLIRIAISFAPFSPALHLTLNVLGKDRALSRLTAVKSALLAS